MKQLTKFSVLVMRVRFLVGPDFALWLPLPWLMVCTDSQQFYWFSLYGYITPPINSDACECRSHSDVFTTTLLYSSVLRQTQSSCNAITSAPVQRKSKTKHVLRLDEVLCVHLPDKTCQHKDHRCLVLLSCCSRSLHDHIFPTSHTQDRLSALGENKVKKITATSQQLAIILLIWLTFFYYLIFQFGWQCAACLVVLSNMEMFLVAFADERKQM